MKNELVLDALEVQELSFNEEMEVDGGNPGLVLVLGYLIWESLENPTASKDSFWEGFNRSKNVFQ